jgi:hypothetical protein
VREACGGEFRPSDGARARRGGRVLSGARGACGGAFGLPPHLLGNGFSDHNTNSS